MDIFVNHFAYKLGSETVTIEESHKAGRLLANAADFREAGFSTHRMALKNEGPYDLAKSAVEQIKDHLAPTTSIVYATCLTMNGNIGDVKNFEATKDVKYLMDYPASHLQADFGLENAAVIGLNQQACTSMLGSLRIAKALLMSEPDQEQILCVTADRFPEGAVYEQAYNLISDGAAACLVSRKREGFKILATHAITNGALAQATDNETVGCYFSYTHRCLTEIMEKAGLTFADLSWVIPQNTNVNAWSVLCQLFGIDREKIFFESISQVGHIISSDNVVNICDLVKTGKVKSGDKLLLLMAGFGLNWQAVLLEAV
ncbi:MAG: 3-oxoacyl-[acyl-carrier-protein] synthase III C-terminal domain-containing protein [Bdellovibrionota bacterium]